MDFITLRKKIIEKDFGSMNARQFEAVTTANGALLILAGAGSGKTTVLVNRIAYLVKYGEAYTSDFAPRYTDAQIDLAQRYLAGEEDYPVQVDFAVNAPKPWEILAITFTNKAAGELKERIENKLGQGADGVWAGTFHSICGKILRSNAHYIGFSSHFTIYDGDDQKRLIKEIMKSEGVDEKMFPPKSVLSYISSAKDSLITPEEYANTAGIDWRQKTVAKLYCEYQKRMAAANAMDFDDMIFYTVKLLRENSDVLEYYSNKFKYIMVDEYQDTNHAQYELTHLLASAHGNICVVGDDDQSIYRFRGATIENILEFENDYENAKVIRLEQNYRSTGNILNAANEVIANNKSRKGKQLWTDKGDGEPITVHTAQSEYDEARYVAESILESVRGGKAFCDHAVLYRMNAQSAAMENVFARSGISYQVIGGMRFYERKEIRDILAYLNLINNNNDEMRLRRIVNEPRRGIGDATIKNATQLSQTLGTTLFETLEKAEQHEPISRAALKLKEFCNMIRELTELAQEVSLSELLEAVLEKTGYRNALLCDTDPKAQERLENINEFANNIKQFELENDKPTLTAFLEEIALVSDLDSLNQSDDKVTLMTIHSAKGLEFEKVYLIGFEEGIFPGNQSIYGGEAEIEEERRLCYVAITRAKRHLTVTHANSRMLYGSTGRNLPSRFLREIPREYCVFSAAQSDFGGFQQRDYGHRGDYGYGEYSSNSESGHIFGRGIPQSQYASTPSQNRSVFAKEKANDKDGGKYAAGAMVEHKTFGKGMIISVSPMGNDTLLEIAFENVGTKRLMAAYAKLKIL